MPLVQLNCLECRLGGVDLLADVSVLQGHHAAFVFNLAKTGLGLRDFIVEQLGLVLEQLHLRSVIGSLVEQLLHALLRLDVLLVASFDVTETGLDVVTQHKDDVAFLVVFKFLPIQSQHAFVS